MITLFAAVVRRVGRPIAPSRCCSLLSRVVLHGGMTVADFGQLSNSHSLILAYVESSKCYAMHESQTQLLGYDTHWERLKIRTLAPDADTGHINLLPFRDFLWD